MNALSTINGGAATAARRPVWDALGSQIPHHLTPSEALEAAGLNWTVDQHEILFKHRDDAEYQVVPEHVANVRSDTGKALGVVGANFVPIDNWQLASFAEAIIGESEATLERVFAFRQDRRQAFCLRLGEGFDVVPGDRVKMYLLLVNGHDGSQAFRAWFSSVRLVCSNVLTLALRDASTGVSVRHTGNVAGRIEQARHVLSQANGHFQELGSTLEELASATVSLEEAEQFAANVFPFPPRATERQRRRVERERETVVENFLCGPGAGLAGSTGWGLLNSVSEAATHGRAVRGGDERQRAERRFESLLPGGTAQKLEQRAFVEACRLLDVA